MAVEPYLVAIDLGSSSIKLAVAKNSLDSQDKVQILALVERSSFGVKRGMITNMSEATEAIIEIVNQAESIIGLPIRKVIVGINGISVNFTNSEGLIIISRGDNEILESDVDRVIHDSLTKAYNLNNNEIIHTIPRSFNLDNQAGIRYPVGMMGSKLECKTLIISAENSYIRNFTKIFHQASLDVLDIKYSPLASSEFLFTPRQKKAGTALVDIGLTSTVYVIWENEEILGSGVIPIGSDHITADLAVGLQTSIELAEEIKQNYLSFDENDDISDEIEIFNPDTQTNETFSTSDIRDYSRPRVEEIFYFLNKELKRVAKSSQLAGGIFLIGGGANLKGINEVAKEVTKLPIFKYFFDKNTIDFVPDYDNDPSFINAIALAAYSLYHGEEIGQGKKMTNLVHNQSQPSKKESRGVLSFLKGLMPWS